MAAFNLKKKLKAATLPGIGIHKKYTVSHAQAQNGRYEGDQGDDYGAKDHDGGRDGCSQGG
jgi:hypothetical protein